MQRVAKRKALKRVLALMLAAGMIFGEPMSVLAVENEVDTIGVTEDAIGTEAGTTPITETTGDTREPLTETEDSATEPIAGAEAGTTDGVTEPLTGTEASTTDPNTEMSVPEADAQTGAGDEVAAIEEINEAEEEKAAEKAAKQDDVKYTLEYQSHIQTYGWQDWKKDGEQSGTTGLSKRMEAISIRINKETKNAENPDDVKSEVLQGAVSYQIHSQTYGNLDEVQDGAVAGTTGESKRVEAVRIQLNGEVAEKYDIYYQVHCSKFGDMGWAKNGEWAGTNGYSRAVEAITIRLVEKGSADAPAQTSRSFISPTDKGLLTYQSHVQTYGWLESVADGEISGTQGQSKRMEAIQIYMTNPKDANGNEIGGSIEYRVQKQTHGWMDWVGEGEVAGSEGDSKRLETIQIRLTGEMANQYDVFYRVHCAKWGNMGWAKNGEVAGTIGFRRAIESIEIRILPKGSSEAPEQTGSTYRDAAELGTVNLTGSVNGIGWQDTKGNNGVIGTIGESKSLDAIRLSVDNGAFEGSITYSAHMQGTGWTDTVSDGAVAGEPGSGKRMEAVQINLTGELAEYFDVYYSAQVQAYGWLGWAKNGQIAGTTNCSYRLEALQVYLVPKTSPAPGANENYFKDVKKNVRYENAVNTILNEAGYDLYSVYRWAVDRMHYQTLPIPMAPYEGYTEEESYAIYAVENRRGNCYCFAAAFVAAAKALGYDARLIQGSVGMAAGGLGPHGWAEIDIDGVTYVCDPDGEYELGMNFYMVHYGSAGLAYYK